MFCSILFYLFFLQGGREGGESGWEGGVCVWGGGEGDVVVSGRMTQEM